MDWQIPLLVSAIAFGAFLVFKMRPAVGPRGRATAAALVDAKKRLEAASDDATRALALADAGDACADLGRMTGAVGFYHRALRADPRSAEIVERAARALARRPSALENLMWRHLAAEPWAGDALAANVAALRVLVAVYGRRPRFAPRARALEHAIEALAPRA